MCSRTVTQTEEVGSGEGPADGAGDDLAGGAQGDRFRHGQPGKPQRESRPCGHRCDRGRRDQSVRGPGRQWKWRLQQQVAGGVASFRRTPQLGPEICQVVAQGLFGLRRCVHPERSGDDRGVGHVAIAVGADQRLLSVPVVNTEEAVELGDVHPQQQVRIVGRVRLPVGRRAGHSLVHPVDHIDRPLRLGGGPECRGREEVGGALQATPGIAAVVGVLGNPRHRQGMQRLEEQRAQPADEHRSVRVDASNRGIVVEPARLRGVEQFGVAGRSVRTDHAVADLPAQPGAHVRNHWPIVPRAGEYHPDVPDESPPGAGDQPSGDDGTRSRRAADSTGSSDQAGRPYERRATDRRLPRWAIPAIVIFWTGYLLTFAALHIFHRLSGLLVLLLVSIFLALAIEPGVNRLAQRGWRRGRSTIMILLGVLLSFLVFAGAVGTLVGTQVADLLRESDAYITDTVDFLNDNFGTNIDPEDVIDEFNDPDGRVQEFIQSQSDEAIRLSVTAVGVIFQALSVLLFTYYLVADGPRLRRSICSRLPPVRQQRVLQAWELAITKTGGYLYSRALLAALSAFFHWVVFQALGTQAPIALALWVGLVSQFLPVVGTYLAGILPVLVTFLDSPLKAAIVAGFIIIYQQIENYFFAPRITARTMELHPAVAFGAALAGASLLGFVGALLALPAAAMAQALASEWGQRYDVVDSHLTAIPPPRRLRDANGDSGTPPPTPDPA